MIPVWGFLAVVVPLVLTPGASTAVVLRNSLAGGTRAGVAAAIGANSGSVCYGLLSAFGFAFVIQRWPAAWLALRMTGAGYLAWLGARSLHRAIRPRTLHDSSESAPADRTLWASLSEGFATNALNPAIAAFYFVLVPQFVPRGAPILTSVLLLTATHVTLAATWHVTWAAAGGTLSQSLSRRRPQQILEGVTGAALLAFAIKLASAR